MSSAEEKRVSLRFRMNKERDREAYKKLEKLMIDTGDSINDIILDLLCRQSSNDQNDKHDDILANHIAEIVLDKIAEYLAVPNERTDTVSDGADDSRLCNQGFEEPTSIDDDALSFLSTF